MDRTPGEAYELYREFSKHESARNKIFAVPEFGDNEAVPMKTGFFNVVLNSFRPSNWGPWKEQFPKYRVDAKLRIAYGMFWVNVAAAKKGVYYVPVPSDPYASEFRRFTTNDKVCFAGDRTLYTLP